MEATLLTENLSQFCPITNHYACSDGTFLLVTVPAMDSVGSLEMFGVKVPISVSHLPTTVDVYLSDEDQNVLDADGDLANGMTPLAQFDVDTCPDHAAALAARGYTLTTEGT
ncbi:hypothetical protein H7J86_26390 [Mycobacterium hackensackense]|uniref:DUF7572 family protein n=1 Tax=Mycobacterium hackensackense TaxID=228909 RepID=UPI002265D9CC|nr:hypothetical protein [Mycobacterium hackensackense]MCV7255699.1 hypothetical protein [Mycobacterium hackensackense]